MHTNYCYAYGAAVVKKEGEYVDWRYKAGKTDDIKNCMGILHTMVNIIKNHDAFICIWPTNWKLNGYKTVGRSVGQFHQHS